MMKPIKFTWTVTGMINDEYSREVQHDIHQQLKTAMKHNEGLLVDKLEFLVEVGDE